MIVREIVLLFHAAYCPIVWCTRATHGPWGKRKKMNWFSLIEMMLISYGKDKNAGFLSPVEIEIHRVWNPIVAQTSSKETYNRPWKHNSNECHKLQSSSSMWDVMFKSLNFQQWFKKSSESELTWTRKGTYRVGSHWTQYRITLGLGPPTEIGTRQSWVPSRIF